MIVLRKAEARRHDDQGRAQIWLTFFRDEPADALAGGFNGLETLDESRLSPGAPAEERPARDAEIVTYVREGALSYRDRLGETGVVSAGEFQRTTTTTNGEQYSEANASQLDWTHSFHIGLRYAAGEGDDGPCTEQDRFSAAQRRGLLRVVSSPDAREGSLRLQHDALIYSAMLDRGQHVVHELLPGRGAWLHLVEGQVRLGNTVLGAGDGVGVTDEIAVSLTARRDSELLLVDLETSKMLTNGQNG